jgi:hypothetical protein
MGNMPDAGPPPNLRPDLLIRLPLMINGADDHEALRQCSRDRGTLVWPGLILMFSSVYMTGLFTQAAHMLFAPDGQFRIGLLLVGTFLALFVLVIDSYMILRVSHYHTGTAQLRKAGLDISGGLIARFKIGIALTVRIILSLALAQLTALVLSLMVFAPDINARIQRDFLQANAHLLGPATALVDGGIERKTAAVTEQTTLVNGLAQQVASLRQSTVDPVAGGPEVQEAEQEVAHLVAQKAKADEELQAAQTFADNEFGGIRGGAGNSGVPGYGLRWKSAMQHVAQAKAHAEDIQNQLDAARARLDALRKQKSSGDATLMQRAHAELPGFEKRLGEENGRLAKLKNELAIAIANRDEDIRKAIENAPDFVGFQNGIIARVIALEGIAGQDKRIQLIILLVEIVSLSLESAGLLAKVFCQIPTRYASLVARDAYMHDVRLVDEMMDELNKRDTEDPDGSGASASIDPVDRAPGSGGAAPIPSDLSAAEAALPPAPPEIPVAAVPPPPQPLKRGRGRPRIHPVETHPPRKQLPQKHPSPTVITSGIGPGQQGLPPEQPARA